jgi:hypothetical protein
MCCSRQMKRAGFTFALASNGLEAVNAIDKSDKVPASSVGPGNYDVVLVSQPLPFTISALIMEVTDGP